MVLIDSHEENFFNESTIVDMNFWAKLISVLGKIL